MATLTITKNYDDNTLLTEAQLDKFIDDPETLLNTTKINDDNIQTAGINGSLKIKDASISTAKIANLAVTTAKINTGAVTAAKLADSSGTDADRSVTSDHIKDLNVTTAKINNSAVTTAKLAANAATNAKLSSLVASVVTLNTSVFYSDGVSSPGTISYDTTTTLHTFDAITAARPVICFLSPRYMSASIAAPSGTVLATIEVFLTRDSDTVGRYKIDTSTSGGSAVIGQTSLLFFDPTPVSSPNTYVYRLKVRITASASGLSPSDSASIVAELNATSSSIASSYAMLYEL